ATASAKKVLNPSGLPNTTARLSCVYSPSISHSGSGSTRISSRLKMVKCLPGGALVELIGTTFDACVAIRPPPTSRGADRATLAPRTDHEQRSSLAFQLRSDASANTGPIQHAQNRSPGVSW